MKKTIKGGRFALKSSTDTPKEAAEKAKAYKSLKVGDFVRIIKTQWDGVEGIITSMETGDYSNSADKRYMIYVTTYTVDPPFSFTTLDPRNCVKISRTTANGRKAAKQAAIDWRRPLKK